MYSFNELEVLTEWENAIYKAFNTTAWRNKFGKKKLRVIRWNAGIETSLPVVVVEIMNPRPYDRTRASCQPELYTQLDFIITHYNTAVGDKDERTLGIEINDHIKRLLQKKYNLRINTNQPVYSPDRSIYRREIRGTSVYNNKTKTYYLS